MSTFASLGHSTGLAQALADTLLAPDRLGSAALVVSGVNSEFVWGPLRSELERRGRMVTGFGVESDDPLALMHAGDFWYGQLMLSTGCTYDVGFKGALEALRRRSGKQLAILIDGADRLVDDDGGAVLLGSLKSASEALSDPTTGRRDLVLVLAGLDKDGLRPLVERRRQAFYLSTLMDAADLLRETASAR